MAVIAASISSQTTQPGAVATRTDQTRTEGVLVALTSKQGRVISGVAGAAVLALLLPACSNSGIGQNTNDTSGAKAPSDIKLGMAGSKLIDPFQVVMVDGIQADAKKAGINMLPPTNANADAGKQITDIQNLLTQSVNSLIVVPVDSDAVVPGIQQANRAKVPVVTVDVAPNGGDVYMVVRADNYQMGVSACEQLGKAVNGKGTVLNLQGGLATVNGLDRSAGFTDCMAKNFPNVNIIARTTDWEADKTVQQAQAVLSTTPVDGVYLASDSVMGDGIQSVLSNLGKWAPAGAPNHVAVVSIDGTPNSLNFVRQGFFDAVVSQPADLYSQYAVKYAQDAASGVQQTEGKTDHDSTISKTKAGILQDSLASPVITKENAGDEALWGNKKQ
jgi:ABC-type sugar transport system substrate-binding protein